MKGRREPAAVRFWDKVTGGDFTECWIWTAWIDRDGYGTFSVSTAKTTRAHRWAYTHLVAEIPPGLHLDHLCRNRSCVNPWHLEPVTNRVNMLRGVRCGKTHCKWGHELVGRNLRLTPAGRRQCRTCIAQRDRESYHRSRAMEAGGPR